MAGKVKEKFERGQGSALRGLLGDVCHWSVRPAMLALFFGLALLAERREELRAWLVATGDSFLVAHKAHGVSAADATWADDEDGRGHNVLGMLLMLVRASLSGDDRWAVWIQRHTGDVFEKRPSGARGAPLWGLREHRDLPELKNALGGQPLPKAGGNAWRRLVWRTARWLNVLW